jgi:phosphate transport system ATP-binding protein
LQTSFAFAPAPPFVAVHDMTAIATATPATPTAMCCQAVGVSYRGRPSVAGVDLDLERDRITAIIGPSGCGKTSFLSTLNRLTDLIPGAQVTGRILLDDADIRSPDRDVRALRCQIGMIFQRANPFPLSIRRNLEMPLREHGITAASERADRMRAALVDVGLWAEVCDRLDASALALSGGQQQRLCIARALALNPAVLLMDEPCSALDPIASGVVEDLILRLKSSYTVVIVTHNLAQARRIADSVAVFWVVDGVGQLIEHGPTGQIFDAPRHAMTGAYVEGRRG